MESTKKIQSNKNQMSSLELKKYENWNQKSLDKFNSRLNTVEHKMNELEDKSKEYTEAKAQGGNGEKKRN